MIIRGRTWEFDDSAYRNPGVVYDIGCLHWEWREPFLGKKMVIGADPNEETMPDGALLVRAAVLPYSGSVTMRGKGLGALCSDSASPYKLPEGYAVSSPEMKAGEPYEVPAVTWAELTTMYGPACFVKVNIEGAEIPLLMTAHQPMAPQLCVAFHQRGASCSQDNWPQAEAIQFTLAYLATWYRIERTELPHSAPDKWYRMMLK
jgi:hypothetical protein